MVKKNILITGGAGFIGTHFVKNIIPKNLSSYNFHILDALTYAGHIENIQPELDAYKIPFHRINICDKTALASLFQSISFSGVIHFAAESHVDRSIENPNIFFETNALGTLNLLNESLIQFEKSSDFRFLHISTDEVYGSLSEQEAPFTEDHPLLPNSPYSASKASSDLMVRSFFHTYKLPTIITRCSNNYGPYQTAEKLIPLMIKQALEDKQLPVYGNGKNIRDWIYAGDHVEGVWAAFLQGTPGNVYNLGGNSERRNIDIVKKILKHLNKTEGLIQFVTDRKGHDWRYAIDYSKASKELNWTPKTDFDEGLLQTINWFNDKFSDKKINT